MLQASFAWHKYCVNTVLLYSTAVQEAKPKINFAGQNSSLETRPNLESNQTTSKTISNNQNDPCAQRILKPVTKNVTRSNTQIQPPMCFDHSLLFGVYVYGERRDGSSYEKSRLKC